MSSPTGCIFFRKYPSIPSWVFFSFSAFDLGVSFAVSHPISLPFLPDQHFLTFLIFTAASPPSLVVWAVFCSRSTVELSGISHHRHREGLISHFMIFFLFWNPILYFMKQKYWFLAFCPPPPLFLRWTIPLRSFYIHEYSLIFTVFSFIQYDPYWIRFQLPYTG